MAMLTFIPDIKILPVRRYNTAWIPEHTIQRETFFVKNPAGITNKSPN